MKNIGIFGISGDPPHQGHVDIALEASRFVDEVWVMPCYHHPFEKSMTYDSHRMQMCKFTFPEEIHVSDVEIRHRIVGGTYLTLRMLDDMFEDCLFTLIIGQDNADRINQWMNYDKIVSGYPVIVFQRNSNSVDAWYKKKPHTYVENFQSGHYTSTNIRELIKQGKKSPDIAPAVQEYIDYFRLYN